MMENKTRNYGLDLLRMLSMFMIVNLHVLSQGGVMVRVVGHEVPYYACWFIETCAYCAVNCYGLISGYVGVDSKFRPARLLELWFTVFFYSAGITLLYWIFAPQLLEADSLWKAIFPIGWKSYWYFSAYAALFCITPFINRIFRDMQEREARRMAVVLFLVFSVGTALPKANSIDYLALVGGYSFAWLLILYMLGACLKKGNWKRRKNWQYVMIYFGMVIFSWGFKILMEEYTRKIYGEARYGRLFTGYAAPTILLCGICLFMIFQGLQIKQQWMKKVIRTGAPLAFSVYLIHTQSMIWNNVLKGAFSAYRNIKMIPLLMGAVLLTAAGIYIVCSLLDLIRTKLFEKLKIRVLSGKITDKVVAVINHITDQLAENK